MTEHAELVERLKRRADAAMSTVPIDIACGNFKRAQHNTEQAELDREAATALTALVEERDRLRHAAQDALQRLENGAPGWGVAKDVLRAALRQQEPARD